MQELHGGLVALEGPAFRVVLNQAVVSLGRLDELLPFEMVVGARFFQGGVLSGLSRPESGQGVPVIRRRHADGVDGGIVQHAAQVVMDLGPRQAHFIHLLDPAWR